MTLTNYLLLIIVPMLLGLWAQWRVKSAFGKYSQVRATSNVSGAEGAREVLASAQIRDVEVVEINDQQMGLIQRGPEATGVNRVLDAAAWTYVAAFVATLGTLLHFVLMMNGLSRD